MSFLLDTNILIISLRAGEPSQRLEAQLRLSTRTTQGLVSIVTVGEVIAFAMKRNTLISHFALCIRHFLLLPFTFYLFPS